MEKSSFFNAVLDHTGTPDRTYTAEDFAKYFASFVSNGIFPKPKTNLQVIAADNMNILVSFGTAWINGYMYQNTTNKTLTIENADGILNRIDRIVIRLDFNARKITTELLKGEFSSNPAAKELTRNSDCYELAIADVYISKGVTKLTQANITDLRSNENLCGWVTGTVVDGNLQLRVDELAKFLGDLSKLKTQDKTSTVNAINENIMRCGKAVYTTQGLTHRVYNSYCTENSLVTVIMTEEEITPIGNWKVNSYNGYFEITSTEIEINSIHFDYYIQRGVK